MRKVLHSSHWIAELNTDTCSAYDNAELTLRLVVAFRQLNPPTGRAEGRVVDAQKFVRRTIPWASGEWTRWLRQFKHSVERYWNGKFWLINHFPTLEYEVNGVTYRPNIWCKFKLDIVDSAVGPVHAHHLIKVACVHPQELDFKSDTELYDSRDMSWTFKQLDSHGQPIMQRPHVHEIGHLLGNQHVDVGKPHCPIHGDTNAKQCYGIVDADKRNVMGTGMILTPHQARPWQRAISEITGLGNHRSAHDWPASLMRHYPRTVQEVRLGQSILFPVSRA